MLVACTLRHCVSRHRTFLPPPMPSPFSHSHTTSSHLKLQKPDSELSDRFPSLTWLTTHIGANTLPTGVLRWSGAVSSCPVPCPLSLHWMISPLKVLPEILRIFCFARNYIKRFPRRWALFIANRLSWPTGTGFQEAVQLF